MEKYQSILQQIDQNEIKQLLEHQKSLLQEQQKYQIDKTIEMDLKIHNQKQSFQLKNNIQNQSNKKLSEQQIQKRKQRKLNQYLEDATQISRNQMSQIERYKNLKQNQNKLQKQKRSSFRNDQNQQQKIDKADKRKSLNNALFSQEELGNIIMQNNLSQVSENLNSIISQNDMKIDCQQLNMVDSNILGQQSQTTKIRQIIQEKNMSKSRGSIMKFMKKNNSQIYKSQLKNSLNFSQSKKSRNSEQKQPQTILIKESKKQQLILNSPTKQKNKFNSIVPILNIREVQGQLVQSYFEQSVPKQEKLENIMKQANKLKNQKFNFQKDIIFQNVIKNPPKAVLKSKFINKNQQINYSYSKKFHKNKQECQNNEKDQTLSIAQQWIQILTLIENDNLNQAYKKAFQMDDSIYLLRLMLLTKTPLRRLTAQIASLLWKKFLQIYNNRFIDTMSVELFSKANNLGMLKNSLSIEQLQSLLLQLYQISGNAKGKLSFNAATLYNSIEQSLKREIN